MVLSTRWLVGRPVDAIPIWAKPGFCPSVWSYVDYKPGLTMGCIDVRGLSRNLVALTWDMEIISMGMYRSDINALEKAPASDCILLPELGTLGDWGNLTTLSDYLEDGKQDGLVLTGALTVQEATRSIARRMLLQQSLATYQYLPSRSLDDLIEDLPVQSYNDLESKLRAIGVSKWGSSDTYRIWMRDAINGSFARKFVEEGSFALGRAEANLR